MISCFPLFQRHKPSTSMAIKNVVQFSQNFVNHLGNDDEVEEDTKNFDCRNQDIRGSREHLFAENCNLDNINENSEIFQNCFSGWPLDEVPKNLTFDNYSIKMNTDTVNKNGRCF